MGRRSINTTKGGKYMNPTDQARKEARKKELKKNKKQRLMVRQAVLKGKDPAQLLEEMEKIDEMEFNVYQPSPLNEKVLKEKRKKLKETFDRVMRLYHADNPEVWGDLKRKELDYELRRSKKEQYFESVKHAQSVVIDEIPLPQLPTEGGGAPGSGTTIAPPPHRAPPVLLTNVPIPSFLQQQQEKQGILKKSTTTDKVGAGEKERDKTDPPGCPPGPPPNLTLMRELDDDYAEEPIAKKAKIRFSDEAIAKDEQQKDETSVQKRLAILAGKNIDDLMREVEHDQRRRKEQRERSDDDEDNNDDGESDRSKRETTDESDSEEDSSNRRRRREKDREQDTDSEEDRDEERDVQLASHLKPPGTSNPIVNPAPPPAMPSLPPQIPVQHKPPMIVPPPPPMGLPPGNMVYHPPPMRPGLSGMPLRMHGNRPGLPPGPPPMGMRMPPGPPPPRMRNHGGGHHHGGGYNHHSQQHHHHHNQSQQHNKDPKSATITAKPQIRNLSADVTRFVPSTLRAKKEEKGPQKPPHMMPTSMAQKMMNRPGQGGGSAGPSGTDSNKGKTKDDAYIQFMREMQGLL